MAPRNPAALVAALKLTPVAKDQFQGNDYPGSYLWQKGGLDAEQFHAQKQAKLSEPKMPAIKPIPTRPAKIPAGGIKLHGY